MQNHELTLDILAFVEHLIHRCSQLNLNTPLLLTKTRRLQLCQAKYCGIASVPMVLTICSDCF
jgi:hypothetical protein